MICGVRAAAIAEPHSVWSWGVELAEVLAVGPVAPPPDPADWLPNTASGFVGELGFWGIVGAPAEPVAPELDVPNTELGLAGELGFGGTAGLPPAPVDWVGPESEVPSTALGFAGELGFGGTAAVPAEPVDWLVPDPNSTLGFAGELGFGGTGAVPAAPPAGLLALPAFGLAPVPVPAAAPPVPVDPPDVPAPPDAPAAPPDAPPAPPPPPPPPWADAIVGLAARNNATATASILVIRRASWLSEENVVRSAAFRWNAQVEKAGAAPGGGNSSAQMPCRQLVGFSSRLRGDLLAEVHLDAVMAAWNGRCRRDRLRPSLRLASPWTGNRPRATYGPNKTGTPSFAILGTTR